MTGPKTLDQLEREKFQAEIEHYRAKTQDLQRSSLSRPTFWISVTTVLFAVVGTIVQAKWSKNEYILASARKEKAELALEKLSRQQMILKVELERLEKILENRQKGSEALKNEIGDLKQIRSALAIVVDADIKDRFSEIPLNSTPNEHLRGLLAGWWAGANIHVIRRVEGKEKNGWALSESK